MFTYFFSLGLYHDVWLVEGNLVSLLPLFWISFFTKNNKNNFEFNDFLSPEMAHVHYAHMITNIITRDCCHIYDGALFNTFNFFGKELDVGRTPEYTSSISSMNLVVKRGLIDPSVSTKRAQLCITAITAGSTDLLNYNVKTCVSTDETRLERPSLFNAFLLM